MKVEEARGLIKVLENYINLYEKYEDDTLEKEVIKRYCEVQSVKNVAGYLNDKGYKRGERKFNSSDVSEIICKKPFIDELHEIVFKMFHKNKKRNKWLG